MKGRQLLRLFLLLTLHVLTIIELIQSCLKFPSYIKPNTITITLCKLTNSNCSTENVVENVNIQL